MRKCTVALLENLKKGCCFNHVQKMIVFLYISLNYTKIAIKRIVSSFKMTVFYENSFAYVRWVCKVFNLNITEKYKKKKNR